MIEITSMITAVTNALSPTNSYIVLKFFFFQCVPLRFHSGVDGPAAEAVEKHLEASVGLAVLHEEQGKIYVILLHVVSVQFHTAELTLLCQTTIKFQTIVM